MAIVLASELTPKLGDDVPENIDDLWAYIHVAETEVAAYLGVDTLDEKLETMVIHTQRDRSTVELPKGFVTGLVSVDYGANTLDPQRFRFSGWTLEFLSPLTPEFDYYNYSFQRDNAYVLVAQTGWKLSTVPNRIRAAVLELAATRFRNPDVVFEEQVGDVRNRYTAAFDLNQSLPIRVLKLLRDYRRVVG